MHGYSKEVLMPAVAEGGGYAACRKHVHEACACMLYKSLLLAANLCCGCEEAGAAQFWGGAVLALRGLSEWAAREKGDLKSRNKKHTFAGMQQGPAQARQWTTA
jgi:hypothetical protein